MKINSNLDVVNSISEQGTSLVDKYLGKSGGAMTGNISFQGTNSTNEIIKFKNNTSDSYGNGIAIGGGGIVIIGAGESSDLTYGAAGDENLYLAADKGIHFYSNAQSGLSYAKHMIFDNSGVLQGMNSIVVTHPSGGGSEYKINSTNYSLSFMIGSGDVNRGIFDHTNNGWMIYRDDTTNVYIGGAIYENGTALSEKYQPKDADLTAIASLTETYGFLKKTAVDTWALERFPQIYSYQSSEGYTSASIIFHYNNNGSDETTGLSLRNVSDSSTRIKTLAVTSSDEGGNFYSGISFYNYSIVNENSLDGTAAERIFKLPTKNAGTYTLATTSDIPSGVYKHDVVITDSVSSNKLCFVLYSLNSSAFSASEAISLLYGGWTQWNKSSIPLTIVTEEWSGAEFFPRHTLSSVTKSGFSVTQFTIQPMEGKIVYNQVQSLLTISSATKSYYMRNLSIVDNITWMIKGLTI